MKRIPLVLCVVALAVTVLGAQTPSAPAPHPIVNASEIVWADAAILPPGAKITVLSGDMTQAGPFIARLKSPDGYEVPPHWHPVTENLTVISGTFHLGMGEKFDKSKTTAMRAGAFTAMPAEMRHFAWCEGETIVQVNGMGPFQLIYVDPKDDPRNAKK